MENQGKERMLAKTAQQRYLWILQEEYKMPPRVSEALLAETEMCFEGNQKVKVGQQKVILVKRGEKHGRAVRDIKKVEVIWTVDAGIADERYLEEHGKTLLRQKRIQRLMQEAIEQGGIASQEDLGRVLHVSIRTIKRDFSEMKKTGVKLRSRGYDEGIGRGQTHKKEIIEKWIRGESYDQLERSTGHSSSSIQRYIQKFMQVIELKKQGFGAYEIGRLTQMGSGLVQQYLAIYQQNQVEAQEEWVENQRRRMFYPVQGEKSPKKGAK